ncbi:hypothetical protein [Ahrensia sp. 13_GOM-1096m]|uniref:hypothetical protein n=1 Tax=Ahrensia sp. 13_GOM-1096m TaxID=1380380 RepID=UPI000479DA71|nr:hypothetical protein [Ahrensia sp. 13_GOM-1096m]
MADIHHPIATRHSDASANSSYLEWGPVWAGALVAIAISTVLVQFGASTGLAMGDPIRPDNTVSYNFIIAGLWLLLVSVAASSAAGYISGRMRMTMNDATADEVEFRDGIHGITAWALSTVAVALVASISGSIASAVAAATVTETPELPANLQAWAANQALIVAFATAAGSALGAAAAWFASVSGGKHRDDATSHNVIVPKMFRKR